MAQVSPGRVRIVWVLSMGIAAASVALKLVFGAAGDESGSSASALGLLFAFVVFATVGAVILARRPRHSIGWTYLLGGLAGCVQTLTSAIVDVHRAEGISFPGVIVAWWLATVLVIAPLILIPLPLLLFPDGRLVSRRWRPVLWAAIIAIAFVGARFAFTTPFQGDAAQPANPLGIPAAKYALEGLTVVGMFTLVVVTIAAILSLFLRFRRASGVERQQLKWLGLGGVLTLLLVFVCGPGVYGGVIPRPIGNLIVPAIPYLFGLAIAVVPLVTAIAILRYRLYDIDRIVSRTLGYALITGVLVGAYAVLVVVLQVLTSPITRGSDLAIALSTLVVAAVFRPIRRRVQATIDKRFNRTRYDVSTAIGVFSARLRDQVDIDTLTIDLETLVHTAMEPAHVSLWVRGDR